MGIEKLNRINDHAAWALWRITEPMDELRGIFPLPESGKREIDQISNKYKQLEWLAGRLCIQRLLLHFNHSFEGLYKDEYGKPYLNNHAAHISIANSYPFAAAIINFREPVGIDMEEPKPKLKKVAHKFLNESEQHAASDDVDQLCVYWCAKECLYKIHGRKQLSFKANMYIHPFSLVQRQHKQIQGRVIVKEEEEDHLFRVATVNNHYIIFSI